MINKTIQYKAGNWSENLPSNLDSNDTIVFAFFSDILVKEGKSNWFHDLTSKFEKSHIVGCSTAGEIFGDRVFDDTVSVSVVKFEKTKIKVVYSNPVNETVQDSFELANKLAGELNDPSLKAILVLSEGLKVNGSKLIQGLTHNLGSEVAIAGGLAGDSGKFKETWIIKNKRIVNHSIVGIGFYGDSFKFQSGSSGGWKSFGPRRNITKSKGNVLYEIDGIPALDLYKKYLGKESANLPASAFFYPLSIGTDNRGCHLVRTILGIDNENSSMTFAGDVPEGSGCQLMRASFDNLVAGSKKAFKVSRAFLNEDKPIVTIGISCVGRKIVLGEYTTEELTAISEGLGQNKALTGFYSYGEIGNDLATGHCNFHNQTMTVVSFQED